MAALKQYMNLSCVSAVKLLTCWCSEDENGGEGLQFVSENVRNCPGPSASCQYWGGGGDHVRTGGNTGSKDPNGRSRNFPHCFEP